MTLFSSHASPLCLLPFIKHRIYQRSSGWNARLIFLALKLYFVFCNDAPFHAVIRPPEPNPKKKPPAPIEANADYLPRCERLLVLYTIMKISGCSVACLVGASVESRALLRSGAVPPDCWWRISTSAAVSRLCCVHLISVCFYRI